MVHITRRATFNLFLCICGLTLLQGCRNGNPTVDAPIESVMGSCSLDTSGEPDDVALIQALLAAEGHLVVEQQITQLMRLWADGSYVADGKHTPDDDSDDQFWLDKDAIRHRYVRTVFPGAPDEVMPSDLEFEVDGNRAVVYATTHIGSEIAPYGDRWELVNIDGCWLIHSLTYNLEADQ